MEEAAEKLRARAESLGQKRPRRAGKLRLLPLVGLVAGAAALLRGGERREQLMEKGKGLVSGGKGVVAKTGSLAGKAGSLLAKARQGISQLRNR